MTNGTNHAFPHLYLKKKTFLENENVNEFSGIKTSFNLEDYSSVTIILKLVLQE